MSHYRDKSRSGAVVYLLRSKLTTDFEARLGIPRAFLIRSCEGVYLLREERIRAFFVLYYDSMDLSHSSGKELVNGILSTANVNLVSGAIKHCRGGLLKRYQRCQPRGRSYQLDPRGLALACSKWVPLEGPMPAQQPCGRAGRPLSGRYLPRLL